MDTSRGKTKGTAQEPFVPLSQLIAVGRWGDTHGFPGADLLEGAKLPPELLAGYPQSRAELSFQRRLYEIVAERAGAECLLDAAFQAQPASFCISELPLLAAPDLESFRACIQRCWYQPCPGITTRCVYPEPDRVILTVQDRFESPLRWYTLLGTWLRLLRALGLRLQQLALPLPPLSQRWLEVIRAEVSVHNVLLQIEAFVPETAFSEGNPIAFQWLLDQCESSTAPLEFESFVRQEIRMSLQRGGSLSIRDVAHNTALSTRTLQRRLQEEGLRFRSLVTSERCAFAARLLRDSDISVKQIAARVGFEGTSSFDRAFYAWAGMTPVEWRNHREKS